MLLGLLVMSFVVWLFMILVTVIVLYNAIMIQAETFPNDKTLFEEWISVT